MRKIIIILLSFFVTNYICSQWNQISTINTASLKSVKFFNEYTGYCSGGGGIWKTIDGGNNWNQILTLSISIKSMFFVDSMNAFACGNPGKIYKTTNSGLNWSEYTLTQGYTAVEGIAFFNINTGVSVGFQIIQRTTNSGINWVRQDSSYFTEQFAVAALNTGYGWLAGGAPGEVVRKTSNYGLTWQSAGTYSMGSLLGIYPVLNDYVFVCGYGGIIRRTTNGGSSWTRQDSVTSRTLRAVYFVNVNTGTIVGDNGTILHTTNSGINWSIQASSTTLSLNGCTFINSNSGWIVGNNGIILKTTNGGITDIQSNNEAVPRSFYLYQNYPNPFNPKTNFKFSLERGSHIKITIFDIRGKEIAVLVDKEMMNGDYNVDFDASNLPSGVYYYQMEAGEYKDTKKMVLIK